VHEEIIDAGSNPMKKILRPDVPQKIIQDIPLCLIKNVIYECGHSPFTAARDHTIILVFLDTGIRLGACAGMTMRDIDLETGLNCRRVMKKKIIWFNISLSCSGKNINSL
jgi:integrase